MSLTNSNLPTATAEQIAHDHTWTTIHVGVDAAYTAFAKNEPDAKATLGSIFAAMTSTLAAEEDIEVVGELAVTDNSGDADHETTQAAVDALQEKVDELVVMVNSLKNQHQ